MTELRISGALALPEDAVTSTMIVFGGKGMGKTNFGAVLVEEMSAARLRWVVLDGLGVWWGLRHSIDGTGKGIQCLILGGTNGDIPIEPTGGGVVADLVVDEDVDVIVDFSRRPDGRMWSKGERMRFVTDFAVRIFQRQGELVDNQRRPPLHVVLDEAARYIPQVVRAGDKDGAFSVSAWEDLVEEGRNVGIGVTLLTQRSARINKSVSELADALFAFRTVGPLSIAAITDWLGDHVPKERIRELVERIRSLPVGSALVVSPGWLHFEDVVGIRARQTYDSSATPRAGETRRVTGQAAKPDLEKYRQRMSEVEERVKADDPRELRKRIAELERQLASRPTETKVERIEKLVEVPVLTDDQVRELGLEVANVRAYVGDIRSVVDDLAVLADKIEKAALGARRPGEQALMATPKREQHGRSVRSATSAETEVRALPPAPRQPDGDGDVRLGQGEQKVLSVLAEYPDGRTYNELAFLAGYSAKASTLGVILSKLRKAALVEPGNQPVRLTAEGLAAAGGARERPTGPALLEQWLRHPRMGAGERRVLQTLIDAYPDDLDHQELCARTGYSPEASTIGVILSKLRKLGLVENGRRRIADEFHEAIT